MMARRIKSGGNTSPVYSSTYLLLKLSCPYCMLILPPVTFFALDDWTAEAGAAEESDGGLAWRVEMVLRVAMWSDAFSHSCAFASAVSLMPCKMARTNGKG